MALRLSQFVLMVTLLQYGIFPIRMADFRTKGFVSAELSVF